MSADLAPRAPDPLAGVAEALLALEAASGTKVEGVRQASAHPYREGVQAAIDIMRGVLGIPDPDEPT